MSDQQKNGTGAQPTGQSPYSEYGIPMSTQIPQPSSGITFKEGALDAASGKINGQTALFDTLRGKSGHLGVPFPSFGAIGIGLTKAHDSAIVAQSAALERGKKALQSWQAALKEADANYREAEGTNAGLYGLGRGFGGLGAGGGAGGGGGPTPTMPDTPEVTMPDGAPPGADPPGADLPGSGLPGTDLPGTDLPGTDRPGSDLPGTGGTNGDLPGVDRSGTDLPGGGLQGIDRPDSNLSGGADPNMKVPDIDSVLNSPQDPTRLSSYDPRALSGTPNANPADLTTRPGTGWGSPGGNGAGSTAGLRAPGTGAAGGMGGGMPMMPMMPGAGAGSGPDERDRKEGSLLSEDEGVWEDDEDIAPEIIGREA
ncbi:MULTISPECIES: hypothetical protein [unclassified Nonomuraea]|uniref:hypothetical protein n=1 Tax=unclassified Nonomuraea TaxID=2593643 RepID=UPI0033FA7362